MARVTVATSAAVAVAAVALVRQARQRADRDATAYRDGYLDGLRDVRRGLLDKPTPQEDQ
ncbi:hypothetical protein [Streptomyces sp. NPDC007063]|uniref:hypothetical protein n=1 Tax=Streptomyces sp. NPDC007063 TaxID=3364772 RepID=UPI00367D9D78